MHDRNNVALVSFGVLSHFSQVAVSTVTFGLKGNSVNFITLTIPQSFVSEDRCISFFLYDNTGITDKSLSTLFSSYVDISIVNAVSLFSAAAALSLVIRFL